MMINDYKDKYNEITRTFMRMLSESRKDENIVFSPLSIIMLLAIASDAADGVSREEIDRVLGTDISHEELMGLFKELQSVFSKDERLISSNAVCVKEDIKDSINQGYEDRLEEMFDGKLFSSKDIVSDVNAWVKEKTKGMIEDIADESMNQMVAALLNAIAFESDWAKKYDEDDIDDGDFHNADGTESEVKMLSSTEGSYIENDLFTGFIKPYKGLDYSFMALLPKDGESASFNKRCIEDIDFSGLFHSASYIKVFVDMPEFKYDFGEELTSICKELGINTVFTPCAVFSPMSSEQLMVDSIIHKAHIEVDRKGTKAAAATMGVMCLGCAPMMEDYKEVNLDRPFTYAIMHNETGFPIFAGVFNKAE